MQEIDLGPEYQLVFELRPAHDPTKAYGFVNVVVCLKDLSSSIWVWHRDGAKWAMKKVIDIPAEPADEDQLRPAIKGFKACPPLVTDIDLSVDDRYPLRLMLGNRRPPAVRRLRPVQAQADRQGPDRRHRGPGRASQGRRPAERRTADGRGQPRWAAHLFHELALRRRSTTQFYPDGVKGWMVKLDANPNGGIELDPRFFIEWRDGYRPHQVHLQGGDASSDSYCYPVIREGAPPAG